jgi:hypothetical protein
VVPESDMPILAVDAIKHSIEIMLARNRYIDTYMPSLDLDKNSFESKGRNFCFVTGIILDPERCK